MQLTEHVYLVGNGVLGFDMTDAFDCHVYLIDGGSELALIDTGAGIGHAAILANVKAHTPSEMPRTMLRPRAASSY
jgi:glyoxylase-like metal-dependent hydrolase (beta-lactamase superfamily II)